MKGEVRVMLCCNDKRGLFRGRVDAIRFEHPDGTVSLCLDDERVSRSEIELRITKCAYRVSDWQTWVGNIFWDSLTMRLDDAQHLLRRLLERGAQAEEWSITGPFAKLLRDARLVRRPS